MKIFHVEFYDRITGFLEHNDTYVTLEEAAEDAHGRHMIVTGHEIAEDILSCS